ncbi:peroxisomal d3,d2-enoyl-CoA isomerase-like protein [Dendryphion nanum]|uniref:Peroxisomal d3,d2-enoyl-CoA isomerase-like protein n=1 Tax=Dendryphion nanum TaxID=256645 RepID=A0A9P9DV47_9PLEO|nr:peroxisomal d3,d2-enoyl-CoA isomerase-like protein [Dendryphion nanum]
MAEDGILVEYKGKVAIITLNQPKKLNALNQDLYYALAKALVDIAARDDIYITVLTGNGRFFSAGADVAIGGSQPDDEDTRRFWLKNFVSNNLHITHAFYSHPKILVTALNGPAVGLSAALIAFSDFIYAAPHAYLLTPFSSLGLVAEGNASIGFVRRLGISKANEALIMSKRITIEDLVQTGFVNKVIDVGSKDSPEFLKAVLKEVDDRLGDHLNNDSLIKIKALIRKPEMDALDKQGVEEVFAGLQRFMKGIPQEEFRKLASGEKKHKL